MGLSSDPFPKTTPQPLSGGTRDCSLVHAGGISTPKSVTLTGNGPNTENLFTVTDQVRVMAIYLLFGTVADSTTFSNVKFETDDGAAQDAITAVVDCSGAVAGAIAYRKAASGTALAFLNAAAAGIDEAATNKVNFDFVVAQKTGATTSYIRLSYTGDANTDLAVTAVCRWQPLCSSAKVEAV